MKFKILKQFNAGNWLTTNSSNCLFLLEVYKDWILTEYFLQLLKNSW